MFYIHVIYFCYISHIYVICFIIYLLHIYVYIMFLNLFYISIFTLFNLKFVITLLFSLYQQNCYNKKILIITKIF